VSDADSRGRSAGHVIEAFGGSSISRTAVVSEPALTSRDVLHQCMQHAHLDVLWGCCWVTWHAATAIAHLLVSRVCYNQCCQQ
jgi:hypothetical protein